MINDRSLNYVFLEVFVGLTLFLEEVYHNTTQVDEMLQYSSALA